ncbi:hypothetical protein PSCLAVI8L_20040 [Pseudoclavibacter sp. 8L]|nr:hypothetical protein PSCLAVI8L_20040 [Pseudoclavibacter sp. 8L]
MAKLEWRLPFGFGGIRVLATSAMPEPEDRPANFVSGEATWTVGMMVDSEAAELGIGGLLILIEDGMLYMAHVVIPLSFPEAIDLDNDDFTREVQSAAATIVGEILYDFARLNVLTTAAAQGSVITLPEIAPGSEE